MKIFPAPPRETVKLGDNTKVVLGIKGVVMIITVIATIVGGYYALQYQVHQLENRIKILEIKK